MKKFLVWGLAGFFWSFVFGFTTAAAAPATVVIGEAAVVQGAIITLGDLAVISGDDQELIDRLRQLRLGSAPSPGASLLLTDKVLIMRLNPGGYPSVVWSIPSSVTVTAGSQTIDADRLTMAAIAAIRKRIGSAVDESDLVIAPAGVVRDIIVPPGEAELTVELPYGIRYHTPTVVRISILNDGRLYNRLNVSFDIRYYRSVVVTARQINARQVLLPEDLRYERLETSRLPKGYFTDSSKMTGLMIRRSLTPGAVITDSMLEKPVIIKRGSLIAMIARTGDIEVQVTGEALQDGSLGQVIRVKNLITEKIVSAKVLDPATVQVITLSGG